MTPREKLAALLNGKATTEILGSPNLALSGAWVGHKNASGEKLYLTTDGAFTLNELEAFNEDRPGNWQAIDIPADEEVRRFYQPVQGVGRPVQDAQIVSDAYLKQVFGLDEN